MSTAPATTVAARGWPGNALRLTSSVTIYAGDFDPNGATSYSVQRATGGSLFLRGGASPGMYFCSASARFDPANGNLLAGATWSAITIP